MSTAEAIFSAHLHDWLPTQPELHESPIHAEKLGQREELPFDCSTACTCFTVEAS